MYANSGQGILPIKRRKDQGCPARALPIQEGGSPAMNSSQSWYADAACKGVDVNVFFRGTAASNQEATTKFCDSCPVRQDCLEDALQYPPIDQYGLAGGISAHERKKIIAKRNYEASGGAYRVCDICGQALPEDAHHRQKVHSGACRQESRRRLARYHDNIRRSKKVAVPA